MPLDSTVESIRAAVLAENSDLDLDADTAEFGDIEQYHVAVELPTTTKSIHRKVDENRGQLSVVQIFMEGWRDGDL